MTVEDADIEPGGPVELDEQRFLDLFRYITAMMRPTAKDEAEDLAAESINRCIPHLRAGKVLEDSYFLRCARNLWVDRLRRGHGVLLQSLPEPSFETLAFAEPGSTEDDADTGARDIILNALTEPQRDLILLVEEGHGITESADLLGVSPDAAKKRMQRIRERTANTLAGEPPRFAPGVSAFRPRLTTVVLDSTAAMEADRLPPRQAEIIDLIDNHGLTRTQVAARLGLQRGSVYTMENQARRRMRDGFARVPSSRSGELSPRRRELLGFLVQGMTDLEIGTQMSISRDTVKNQLQTIMKILHARNRTHAVAEAIRLGLVAV